METKQILGILVVIILVVSLVGTIYLATFGYSQQKQEQDEKKVLKTFKLDKSQVQGIKTVNFNFTSKAGNLEVYFPKNTKYVYEIQVESDNNSKTPEVTYNRQGDVLTVNANVESGSATAGLDNTYTYNGNVNMGLGGINLILGNNSQINQFNSTIRYFGGGSVLLQDTNFNQINLKVNTGGFMIMGTPKMNKSGNLSTDVLIGGTNIALNNTTTPGVNIQGTVDLGGISFEPMNFQVLQNNTTNVVLHSKNFDQQNIKLNIDNVVGLGGININTFWLYMIPSN